MSLKQDTGAADYRPMAEREGTALPVQRERRGRNPLVYIQDAVTWLRNNNLVDAIRSLDPTQLFADDDDDSLDTEDDKEQAADKDTQAQNAPESKELKQTKKGQ